MKQATHSMRKALPLSAKSMLNTLLLIVAMLMPQAAWAGACAYTPGCASIEDMQVHLNGTNGNYNGSANNEVVASLKFNYWLDIFNYDGDNGYWAKDLTMKIDGQTLTFYSDYACTTKVSTDYSTVLQGVWGVFGDSNEDHTIGKNKSGSGNKAYFKTSSGLKGYINIYNYYAASSKWTTMKVEVFIYDLYGHKVSVCGTYKRPGKSDIAYDYVFYLGGCPRPKNVTTSQSTTQKEVTISWQKETYSIPASDATGETRVKAYNVIDNGNWGVYRNNYTTSIQTVGNTATSAADNSASCSSSPYTYYVCYEPKATYKDNGSSLTGSETHLRGISGSSSITLTHVWSNSGSLKDAATCTAAAVYYQKCIYCSSTSDANHTYTSGSALGHGSTGYNESYSWTGNAYNDASKDTKACTFTLTCKKCSTKVVNGASLTCIKTAHVDATCIATGSTTYQATGSYTAANSAYNYSATKTNDYTVAALGHGSAGYDENYSWTGNAYNNAYQDTKACIFTLTCKKCRMKVVNGASLTCIKTAHVDATCTATGSTTYMATGSYTAANSAYNYHATKTHEYPIAALGHGSTGYTPTYTWGETYDDATCTFTLQCGSCGVEVFNDNITTTKVDANHVDATCGKDGNERWTATGSYSKAGDATYNGEAQVKDYAIPATGLHTFDDDDLAQSVCTVCDHGFFRYTTSDNMPVTLYQNQDGLITDADGNSFISNTYVDGKGVMEFNKPLETIGQSAFMDKKFTGSITIPYTVKSIGERAFVYCHGFTSVELTSVPQVGPSVFYEVTNNRTVVLSDKSYVYTGENPYFPEVASVTAPCTLDLTRSAVAGHRNLTLTHGNSVVDAAVAATCTTDGLTEGSHCDLCHTVLVVQETVPAVGHTFDASDYSQSECTVCHHGFFRYTSTENKVVVPNPYQMRGSDNKALTVISNNNGVIEYDRPLVTIGISVFEAATNKEYLTGDLVIPGTVKSIGQQAFLQCKNLNGTIVLPPSLNKIGNYAFYDCNPKRIEMHSIPQLESKSFYDLKCTMTAVLSDDSYVYTGENPNFPAVQSATYTRRGIKNQWGTIVVPFDVNGSGDDYDLYTLSSVSEFELTLTKVNGTLAAGTPAIIRLHDDLDGNYDLTLTAASNAVSCQLAEGSKADGYQLVGTYETTELSADDYFISNNKFWSVGEMVYNGAIGVKTAPFRAYIHHSWAGAKARRNAPASPTELKRLDADGNGVIGTADIDRMVTSMLNGENDYSIGDVVRAIDNAGTSVAVATEMLEKGVKGDPDEPELDEYRWITIE